MAEEVLVVMASVSLFTVCDQKLGRSLGTRLHTLAARQLIVHYSIFHHYYVGSH